MMDVKEELLLWFINFLIKSPLHLEINLYQAVVLTYHWSLMNNWLKNYANQLLENFKKEKFILDLKIMFVVLI